MKKKALLRNILNTLNRSITERERRIFKIQNSLELEKGYLDLECKRREKLNTIKSNIDKISVDDLIDL